MCMNCICSENYKYHHHHHQICHYWCLNFVRYYVKHITYSVFLRKNSVLQTFDQKIKNNNELIHFCFMKNISCKSTLSIQLL